MKLYIVLLSAIFLSGCIYYRFDGSPAGIVAFAQEKQSKGVPQNLLWYQGRQGEFDYFKYVYGMFAERRFRVKAGEIPVATVFPFTSDYKQWSQVKSINVDWTFNTYNGK